MGLRLKVLSKILAVAVTSFLFFEKFFGLPDLSSVELSARMGFSLVSEVTSDEVLSDVFAVGEKLFLNFIWDRKCQPKPLLMSILTLLPHVYSLLLFLACM